MSVCSCAGLERALSAWGTVATLDGDGVEPDDFPAALEQAEERHGQVLLVEGARTEWRDFCRRQCDRLLAVVAGEPPPVPPTSSPAASSSWSTSPATQSGAGWTGPARVPTTSSPPEPARGLRWSAWPGV